MLSEAISNTLKSVSSDIQHFSVFGYWMKHHFSCLTRKCVILAIFFKRCLCRSDKGLKTFRPKQDLKPDSLTGKALHRHQRAKV